jgi:hypothetical protein
VEHPCPHCGSPVDNSSPFCSQCGTPQIRFSRPESSAELLQARPAQVLVPPAQPSIHYEAAAATQPRGAALDSAIALRSAVLAAALGAILSVLPFGFIIALPLAGFLAVLFYRKRSWRADPSTGASFRLGALTGFLTFAIFLIFTAVEALAFGAGGELRQMMIEAVHRAQARNPDQQAQQVFQYFLTPHGLAVMMITGLIFTCIAFVLLSGLGGTMAASILRRKQPPE